MNSNAPADPATFLSGRERRAWRQAERRALRDRDALQLTTLRTLAATGGALTGLLYQDFGRHTAPAEFIIAGKRIRAGRVHRPALRALTQAIAATPAVPLLAASRYGPYWVLTFELPTAPLAVLADKLIILPDTPGASVAGCGPPGSVKLKLQSRSPEVLYYWIENGQLPARRGTGRKLCIPWTTATEADCQARIAGTSTPPPGAPRHADATENQPAKVTTRWHHLSRRLRKRRNQKDPARA